MPDSLHAPAKSAIADLLQPARASGGAALRINASPAVSTRGSGRSSSIVRTIPYASAVYRRQQAVWIYTPPGGAAERVLPVAYFIQDPLSTELQWELLTGASDALDRLINHSRVAPFMAVVPLTPDIGPGGAPDWHAGRGRASSSYLQTCNLFEEVMPLVDACCRSAGARQRVVVKLLVQTLEMEAAAYSQVRQLRRVRAAFPATAVGDTEIPAPRTQFRAIEVDLAVGRSRAPGPRIGAEPAASARPVQPRRAHWIDGVAPYLFNDRALPGRGV